MTRIQIRCGIPVFSLLVVLTMTSSGQAAEVKCENMEGTCTVNNDMGDRMACDCGDSSGTGESGGNEWDDLDVDALSEVCDEQLESFCQSIGDSSDGPDSETTAGTTTGSGDTQATDGSVDSGDTESDPNSATCSNDWGHCKVSQTPYTTHSRCDCEADGSGGLTEEGSDGADEGTLLSEEELILWCEELLADCEAPDTDGTTGGDTTGITTGESESAAEETTAGTSDSDSNADTGEIDPHDIFDCSVSRASDWKSQVFALFALLGLFGLRRK